MDQSYLRMMKKRGISFILTVYTFTYIRRNEKGREMKKKKKRGLKKNWTEDTCARKRAHAQIRRERKNVRAVNFTSEEYSVNNREGEGRWIEARVRVRKSHQSPKSRNNGNLSSFPFLGAVIKTPLVLPDNIY